METETPSSPTLPFSQQSAIETGDNNTTTNDDDNNDNDNNSTTETPPIVEFLSPDCRGRVFRYLTFFDCLRFSETSRTSLEQVIAEVGWRRNDQFLVRPCEELTTSGNTILNLSASVRESELPVGDELVAHNNNSNSNNNNGGVGSDDESVHPFLHRAPEDDDASGNHHGGGGVGASRSWYALPSVLERIEGLYRTIPAAHPFNDDLRNLVLDLKKKEATGDNVSKGNSNSNNSGEDNSRDLLQRLSSVAYAHRLHASLLSRCTIALSPDAFEHRNSSSNGDRNANDDGNESFTVTLERYMGDVLAARCLIGHSYYHGKMSKHCNDDGDAMVLFGSNANARTTTSSSSNDDYDSKSQVAVEGGPSFDQWIDHLISFKRSSTTTTPDGSEMDIDNNNNNNSGDEISSTKNWYQYWVFFHSTLLRISPFSLQQAEQLKLDPFSGILEPFDVYNDAYTHNNVNNNATGAQRQQQQRQQRPWFLPSRTYACFSPECQDVKVLSEKMNQLFRHNNQRIGVLETTLNHFGPLGPSFRGRDRVTTQVMLPHKLYVSLLRNSLLSWTLNNRRLQTYMGLNREYITDLRLWLGDSDNRGVMHWMKLLQDQSRKTRPMTVQPPLVTIRMITLNGM